MSQTKIHPTLARPTLESLGPVTAEEAQLLERLDLSRMPRHVAVIMDGNGRWAQKRHLPRIAGHRSGTQSARTTIETCARLEMPLLQRNEIRMRFLGRIEELPAAVQNDAREAMEKTAGNKGMVLCVALNYGGRAEIVDAMNAILREHNGHGASSRITAEQIAQHLYTEGLPDPDLLIRTSGELRVSNFLLWQIAYAEIFVTDTLWPDFNRARLLEALVEFQKRERRYGGIREGQPANEKPARVAGN